jgi:hypothetical protein
MIRSLSDLDQFIIDYEERLQAFGLPLHEYQALLALRVDQFKSAVIFKIESGYTLETVVRVYYSQAVSVLEVLARFSKVNGVSSSKSSLLLTFKSTDYSFVSLADNFEEPEELRPEGMSLVPFTMSSPTEPEEIGRSTDMNLVAALEAKRISYLKSLVGVDGKPKDSLLGTSCQSCRPSSTSTSYSSEYTSGPAGSTYPDYKTDSKEDDTSDCATDTNDDSGFFSISGLASTL